MWAKELKAMPLSGELSFLGDDIVDGMVVVEVLLGSYKRGVCSRCSSRLYRMVRVAIF